MKTHKEGNTIINIAIGIFLVINLIFRFVIHFYILQVSVLLVSIVLLFLIVYFFRSPERNIVIDENNILCPADGTVVVIEEVDEPEFLKEKRKQVSIFMSPLNVHVNRYPISGTVKYMKYHPGKYLVAWHPKSSTENERTTLVIENKNGVQILVRQIAGALARRIVYYSKENTEITQGNELGFIKFGSRVDLFLPLDAKINVSLNQKVKGGETIIATF